jgi:hypothetical protein
VVRAGTPVRPHFAGLKGANLHAERGQFWARDSVKPPTAHFAAW